MLAIIRANGVISRRKIQPQHPASVYLPFMKLGRIAEAKRMDQENLQ